MRQRQRAATGLLFHAAAVPRDLLLRTGPHRGSHRLLFLHRLLRSTAGSAAGSAAVSAGAAGPDIGAQKSPPVCMQARLGLPVRRRWDLPARRGRSSRGMRRRGDPRNQQLRVGSSEGRAAKEDKGLADEAKKGSNEANKGD